MNFSYAKLTTLRPQKEKWLSTFFIALSVAAAFFVPYMAMGEGYFVFYGDFNVQQIPFYQMCHEAVRNGNIGWNWLTDLGANFIGSYSFYLLGSPFFWLTIPFPNNFVPYLMAPLLILKFACAALTAYLYIRRFTKTADAARLGALLYAFSGFSVYNIFFNHFHEALVFFPLLLLSLELFITENQRGFFALMVAVCALSNYFFFFGMVVFCIIYFFVRLFSRAVKIKFTRFLALLLEAVLGLAMASILLIPSILAITGNTRVSEVLLGWNAIAYGKEHIYLNVIECFFFPPDLPARPVFFPEANVKWSSLGGWLPVFGMTGVFAWCINRRSSWLKRIIAICTFMAMVPILNSAFYAFNDSYYARWFYMPILMMCLATVMISEDLSSDLKSGFKWAAGITLAFALVIGLFPKKDNEGKIILGLFTRTDDYSYVWHFVGSVAIAVLSLVVLYALIIYRKKNRTAFFKVATACVCIVTVIYANVFVATGRSYSYDIKGTVIDDLIEGEVTLDKGDYRIDTYDGIDNTGMYLGHPTINAFHSVVPASVTEFYDYIGVDRTVASRPTTRFPAIRSLLSVKYLLNRTDGDSFVSNDGQPQMSGYKYLKTDGGYYVYENENYIPYGFSYDYYMNKEFCDIYADTGKTQMMLKAILLTDEQIVKYRDCMTDIEELVYEGDYGTLEEEEQVGADKISMLLNSETMAQDAARLAKTAAYSFKVDNDGFTAKVKRDNRSLVFFSVPYDEGWTATVNGKATDIEKVNVGFMAVAVPSGESIIRFTYNTPGLDLGIKITIGALSVFLVYFLAVSIYIRKHPADIAYPEGDELISRWHKDDIAEAALKIYEQEAPRKSILDDVESPPPQIDGGFDGGFKINTDIFDDE